MLSLNAIKHEEIIPFSLSEKNFFIYKVPSFICMIGCEKKKEHEYVEKLLA